MMTQFLRHAMLLGQMNHFDLENFLTYDKPFECHNHTLIFCRLRRGCKIAPYQVDIKEGFWHTFICPTFNRKLKFKKNIFHFQLLLAESSNLTKSSSDNAQISGLMIL